MDQNKSSLLHDFNKSQSNGSLFSSKLIIVLIVVALLGIGTGFVLSKNGGKVGVGSVATTNSTDTSSLKKGAVIGSNDTSTFKDTAEGKLASGGIDGEGQYHLIRPGGDSQSVYLTSSSVDLSQLVGKQIKVWGQTQAAQKAGWLMDVGRVEILE